LKFKCHLTFEHGLKPIILTPLIDVIFLLLVFYILSSSFVFQSGIKVKLPKAITSDIIKEDNLTVVLSSENIMLLDNTIVTIKELKKELQKPSNRNRPLLIKADRRASLGRVVELWDLGRDLGLEKISIATDQEQ